MVKQFALCLLAAFAIACSSNTVGPTAVQSLSAPASSNGSNAISTSSLTAGSGPSVVFTGDACSISGFDGSYTGSATTKFKGGELTLLSCHATLVSGTPVANTIQLEEGGCKWVFTPSGEANLSCPRGF
jgi:hypothetical protein